MFLCLIPIKIGIYLEIYFERNVLKKLITKLKYINLHIKEFIWLKCQNKIKCLKKHTLDDIL